MLKAAIVISLVCAGCFQVASMVGKGLGVQQTAATAVTQAYQHEAP